MGEEKKQKTKRHCVEISFPFVRRRNLAKIFIIIIYIWKFREKLPGYTYGGDHNWTEKYFLKLTSLKNA